MKRPAVLAVDAGGSKVEAALVAASGEVLGVSRWIRSDPEPDGAVRHDGEDPVIKAVAHAVDRARAQAGIASDAEPLAELGMYCMAGVDFRADERRLGAQIRRRGWTIQNALANDTSAVLRAGSERGWGVAVVCGFGINCSGVAPDGRTFRFPAIGTLSGDWGGGSEIGPLALWHAVRAEDGRGEATALSDLVPEHFGLKRPYQVMEAIHFGRLEERRLYELPPLVFKAARRNDPVARAIVDRQADEVVTMAATAIRRLRLGQSEVVVVLGGGIFRSGHRAFFERIEGGLRAVAPAAHIKVLDVPPVLGAALMGLERVGATDRALRRARGTLTDERFGTEAVGHRAARR
jgi:N-acetylglucosamine kinase-like BadF-type ATPase